MAKSGEKWPKGRKVGKSEESGEKWGKVKEKWLKVAKSG